MTRIFRFYILPLLCFTLTFITGSTQANIATVSDKTVNEPQIVVLIHGLMRTTGSMSLMADYLNKEGYQVYSYDYPSMKNSLHEQGVSLHESIIKLLAEHPGTKISFVTHSMGGIIARDALAQLSPDQLKQIGSLVMLAPPNQGSSLAKTFNRTLPMVSYFIKPMADLSSDKASYVHQVPIPKVKMGIIAGRYDVKSPPAETRLKGQPEPIIVDSVHTFIMDNPQTKILVARFLQKGSFVDQE